MFQAELNPCCNPSELSFFALAKALCPEPEFRGPLQRLLSLMRQFGVQGVYKEQLLELPTKELLQNLSIFGSQGSRLQKEIKALDKRTEGNAKFVITRLTFFSRIVKKEVKTKSFLKAAALNGGVLAQALLIRVELSFDDQATTPFSYIKECVMADPASFHVGCEHPSVHFGNPFYLNLRQNFKIEFGESETEVLGTFFSQGNTLTSVCSHACLEIMLNNSSGRTGKRGLVTTEDINEMLQIDHKKSWIHNSYVDSKLKRPCRDKDCRLGLSDGEVIRALEHWGFQAGLFNCNDLKPDLDFNRLVYSYVESGFPVMVVFRPPAKDSAVQAAGSGVMTDHVVAILGHTLAIQSWKPSALARYEERMLNSSEAIASSSRWVESLIVADDSIGMFTTLDVDDMRFSPQAVQGATKGSPILYVIAGTPRAITAGMTAIVAEKIAKEFLLHLFDDANYGKLFPKSIYTSRLKDLLTHRRSDMPLLRVCLVTRKEYIAHLENSVDVSKNKIVRKTIQMLARRLKEHPESSTFWMAEISEPPLYTANITKIGEILIRTTAVPDKITNDRLFPDFIAGVRLPNAFLLPGEEHGRFSHRLRLRSGRPTTPDSER